VSNSDLLTLLLKIIGIMSSQNFLQKKQFVSLELKVTFNHHDEVFY